VRSVVRGIGGAKRPAIADRACEPDVEVALVPHRLVGAAAPASGATVQAVPLPEREIEVLQLVLALVEAVSELDPGLRDDAIVLLLDTAQEVLGREVHTQRAAHGFGGTSGLGLGESEWTEQDADKDESRGTHAHGSGQSRHPLCRSTFLQARGNFTRPRRRTAGPSRNFGL